MKIRSSHQHLFSVQLATLLALASALFYTWQLERQAQAQQVSQTDHPLFISAQSDWRNQQWEQAVSKYRQFVALSPNHPRAAEAHYQIGFYLSYTAAPETAIAEYEKAIALTPKSHIAQEAKEGIAALKYYLQDYQGALDLFREVMRETDDWAAFKDAAYRLKEMSHLIALQKLPNRRTAMDCGARALEIACDNLPQKAPQKKLDKELEKLLAASGGVTFEQLHTAAQSVGVKAWGVRVNSDQLATLPKPFIAHVRTNHYLVVTSVNQGQVRFTDPHRGPSYRTTEKFRRIWRGEALVFAPTLAANLRKQLLSKTEMELIRGGHHLHGNNRGDCSENPASRCERGFCGQGPGLPSWAVNLSNYNLIVQDTDFTYSGLGPSVGLTRTYNADAPEEGIFGRSWTSNYEVALEVEVNGNVNVKREGGKMDHFTENGDGSFSSPLWNHDRLFKNADGTYRLEIKRSKLTQHFNAQGKLTRIADRNGNAVTLQYDTNSRLISVTDAVGRITRFNYHPNGKVSEVIDPIQRKATFGYDSNNNLVSYVDMAGNVVSYTYDDRSYMTSYTTPKGTTQFRNGTSPHFSEINFLLKEVVDPLGNKTSFDTGNEIAWVTDARGNQTFYFNNGNGETTEIEDALGNKTSFDFASGNLIRITDANGHITTLNYDNSGNLLRVTNALSHRIELKYDLRDNLARFTDSLNNYYQYEYNNNDNLTKVIDPKNGTTTITYNSFGQITSLIDPLGNQQSFNYDNAGNRIRAVNAAGSEINATYDTVGRPASLTDENGLTFRYTFDGIDRLIEAAGPGTNTSRYQYECCSLSSITDPSGNTRLEYDQTNRLRRYVDNKGQPVEYEYDSAGNLITLKYPGGKTVIYEYDKANQLKSLTDWAGNRTTYLYDPAGNVISISHPNGTLTSYQYDAADRLVKITNALTNGQILSSYRYTINNRGSRTGVASLELPLPVLAPGITNYSYGQDNRIQTAGAATFTHDANGNLTTVNGVTLKTYSYDVFDRLFQTTMPGYNAQFQYDSLGNRTDLSVDGKSTRQIFDPLGSGLLLESNDAGSPQAYYVYGLGLVSKVTPDNQTFFYHYDGLGSTVAMTDSAGHIVNRYVYDAFGKVVLREETVKNSFQYAGGAGVVTDNSGLLYMGTRYYDPQIGRFLSRDPAGILGGLNLYAYAGNDPIDFIDPQGKVVFVPILVGFAIGAGGDLIFQLISNGGHFENVNWCEVGISGGIGALGGAAWARLGLRFSISANNFGIVRPGYGQIVHIGRHSLPMKDLDALFGRQMAGQLRPSPLVHLGIGRAHYPLNPLLYLRRFFGL